MSNKIGLIISREYFTRVRKRSFLLTTILVPLIIIAFYAVIIAIQFKGSTDKDRVAVIDEAGILSDTLSSADLVFIKNKTEADFVKQYRKSGFNSFLYIPKQNLDSPANIRLHSPATVSLTALIRTERMINRAIEMKRLDARGIKSEDYNNIKSDIDVENTIDTETGGKKSEAGLALIVSYACGILIYMLMIIYGTQVMRGVSEEKTSRIAEVVVSSVKPFQLMMGKILGIGAVGLTQFAIWVLLFIGVSSLLPLVAPEMMGSMQNMQGVEGAGVANAIMGGLSALPLGKILFAFIFYFFAGYLLYASLFAAIGSMATDDQQDTQQLIFPVMMPIILGFVIMTKAINDPQSGLAVFGSIFPLTSPVVMMGRITYDIPVWQMAASMIALILTFIFFTWLAGRIYRTGILMYGKKPRWKDMMRWAIRG